MTRSTFPLVPRHRVAGLPFGGAPSLRRGHGSDVAGARPYVRGDAISTIDWRASARLSTARGRHDFVVRERYAEEAPRVVVLADCRPAMGVYELPLPWLSKPAAARSAIELIVQSATAASASVAYLDYAGAASRQGQPFWLPPGSRAVRERIESRLSATAVYDAPEDGLERGLEFLPRFRSELSSGTFAFIVSDFLGALPPDAAWLTASARRWEIVPVVIQDPLWEQSFPLVGPIVLPLADPSNGTIVEVRLSRREARATRESNVRRRDQLLGRFVELGLDPVLLDTSVDTEVDLRFLEWAERRRDLRNRR
jgi:uncharacterized protein (DUF58 family)